MRDTLIILINISFMLICVYSSGSYEPRDEGSACQRLGLSGICTKVQNCSGALEKLKRKGYHDLERCGFEGNIEIVCCPDLSQRNPLVETTTLEGFILPDNSPKSTKHEERLKGKRKCEKACDKIYADNNIIIDINFHILNGESASVGQFPHAVALGFEKDETEIQWKCGASLISSRFLLTAAHCFTCNGCTDPKVARLGVIDINDKKSAQDVNVKRAIAFPNYDPISKHNDIGIIELVKDVTMTTVIYPACLYTGSDDPKGLQIIGWGQTVSNDASSISRILQYATIQAVPVTECNVTVLTKNRFSSKVILETQICGTTQSDACQGDSGGPLQILKEAGGYELVGVVSYGVQCGTKVPGIYTRVSKYLDWIEEIVWPNEL